jgi:hypothetical protein
MLDNKLGKEVDSEMRDEVWLAKADDVVEDSTRKYQ